MDKSKNPAEIQLGFVFWFYRKMTKIPRSRYLGKVKIRLIPLLFFQSFLAKINLLISIYMPQPFCWACTKRNYDFSFYTFFAYLNKVNCIFYRAGLFALRQSRCFL